MKKSKIAFSVFIIIAAYLSYFIMSNLTLSSDSDYKINGIDISNQYSRDLNWGELNQFKGFVVLRAVRAVDTCKTRGKVVYASLIDKNFEKNWIALENENIVRGAYHFFAPEVPAEIQFETYKKAVQLKKGDLPPILDVENSSCNMNEAMKWMKLAKDYYKVDPILYSEYFFYKIYLKKKNNSYPIWISLNESSMMRPSFKDPDCLFWQNKKDKDMLNFQEKVDYNVFLGDSIEFKKILIQ